MSPGRWLEDDLLDGGAASRRRKTRRRALASCARTCHAFLDPALDVLWRVLDDVDVVLRLLPSFQMASRTRQEPLYIISEEITPRQWDRLQWYARRVRELQCTSLKKLHASLWMIIDDARIDRPLLPNLRRMEISVPVCSPAGFTRLLSPSLHDLKIAFVQGDDTEDTWIAGALIQLVPSQVPLLTSLSIDTEIGKLPIKYIWSLAKFEQIKKLSLLGSGAILDYHILDFLSRTTSLHILEARISFETLSDPSEHPFGEGLRPLLEANICGTQKDLCMFFATHRMERLQALHVAMLDSPTEQSIHDTLSSHLFPCRDARMYQRRQHHPFQAMYYTDSINDLRADSGTVLRVQSTQDL
ncbi:hypothetical protein C8Q74DRAFT_406457 [Fomes fomentarius]|nr:hypothetical protein C8Q74DRAFT_406457 [Fomes fomentarius]